MAKIDDWVEIKSSKTVGVVAQVGELITVRVPQKDWPFPKYIRAARNDIKLHRFSKHQYEEALL